MSSLTLQQKFITFLIVTLLLVLTLNGLLFSQLFASRSTENHQQKIYRAVEELHEELNALGQETIHVSNTLASRQDILSSINLINRYQDITNYQPLIFDVEKEKLARDLSLFARTSRVEMAAIYDKQQHLVAFFLDQDGEAVSGYVSYHDGKPIILALSVETNEFVATPKALPNLLLLQSTHPLENRPHPHLIMENQQLYTATNNDLHTTDANGTKQILGKFVIAKAITMRELSSAITHLGVEFSIFFAGTKPANELERLYISEGTPSQQSPDKSHQVGHRDIELLQRKGYLFGAIPLPLFNGEVGHFIVGLKSELIEQQTLNFRNSALIVLLLTAIFIIPLAIHLMNTGLLRPLKLLANGVKNLRKGEFIQIEGLYKRDELGQLAESFNTMVGDLKRREDQLRTLSMATEQSPVSILITNPDDIIEYINPQFELTTGFEAHEIIGRNIEVLFKLSSLDQTLLEELKSTLSSGDTWNGEFSNLKKSGEHYSTRTSISPIKLHDGSISHYLFIAEDTTLQRKSEEILRSSQKMDAIGQLTGGIAHDFNNILGIIMGNLELLKIGLKDRPKERERIERALSSTQRGAKLTQKLLSFSRMDQHGQEVAYINSYIEGMHDLISKSLTAVIHVETQLADDLWPVKIDTSDLEDALLNLSLNARDAMPKGGALVIETVNKHLDANYVRQNPNAHEGDYVMITVSDTGVGMSPEIQKQIFDPFFTTKERDKGTGLGLSMVYGFVQRSGGQIQIYSEEGKGTTFHIYIPRSKTGYDDLIVESPAEPPRGDETVLIVDDEQSLAEIAVDYLEQLGYKTMVAHSGREALDILATTDGIDLIFSDVVMPGGIDGYHLAFAAIKQQPNLKMLLSSGFTSKREEFTNGEQKIYLKLAEKLLGKPYNIQELAVAIRQTLDHQESF